MVDRTETLERSQRQRTAPPVVGVVAVFSEDLKELPPAHGVKRPCRIGRDAEMEIWIDDSKVSRAHAELAPADGGVLVTDLGSRNGTSIEGRAVGSTPELAPIGSTLRVGNTLFRIVADTGAFRSFPRGLQRGPMLGGPALTPVRKLIAEVATAKTPVLLGGESGTGKECAAAVVHAASGRSGELVAVNCAAIPGDLIESELFGHTKGAFSGSDQSRKGLFRVAHGGTLLLDEIGELPLGAQAKLLRVLDGGEVRAVGEDRTTVVDVRVVAATNRSLSEMVEKGTFRLDLFHRISAVAIVLPPLRDRLEDLPMLAAHFLGDPSLPMSTDTVEKLLAHRWPGNVRELKHVVTAAAARASAEGAARIGPDHLPQLRAEDAPRAAEREDPDRELRARLETALRLREGNVSQVARDLGIRRAGIYEHIKRLGIDPESFRK